MMQPVFFHCHAKYGKVNFFNQRIHFLASDQTEKYTGLHKPLEFMPLFGGWNITSF